MRLIPKELRPTPLVDHTEKPSLVFDAVKAPSRLWFVVTPLYFFRLVISIGWLRVTGRFSREKYAIRIREFLEAMGGLWIKAGQLMSLRRDAFSRELCDELAKLLDQTRAFPTDDVVRIIEEDLGRKVDEIFDEFERHPFAAASIGQLHRARLRKEGIRVALKVQRPHIEERFHQQLFFINLIAHALEKLAIVPQIQPADCIDELVHVMTEEVDYRLEASNIRRMRKTLRRHGVFAPKVFSRYTSRRVLVMEHVDGVLMSDYIAAVNSDPERVNRWRIENNVDSVEVAYTLQMSSLRQIVEDNLFHGDPHPGNIVLLRDSRVALLDFGSIGFIENDYRLRYIAFLRCLGTGEHSKAVDVFFSMNALPVIDIEEAKIEMVRCLRAWENRTQATSLSFAEKSINSLHGEWLKVLNRYQIPGNWLFLKVDRSNVTLDASLMYLSPEMDYPQIIRRYFRRANSREAIDCALQQGDGIGSGPGQRISDVSRTRTKTQCFASQGQENEIL
jgi:ubiquinone biosynthesis protein